MQEFFHEQYHINTLPKTNIAPENGWLEDYPFLLGRPIFRCELLASGGVSNKQYDSHLLNQPIANCFSLAWHHLVAEGFSAHQVNCRENPICLHVDKCVKKHVLNLLIARDQQTLPCPNRKTRSSISFKS